MKREDFVVLCVDDEDAIREVLVSFFEMEGYQCLQAIGGHEALEIVKNKTVHFVVSDIRMPQGNGIELLNSIQEYNPELPSILLVSGYSELSREDAIKKGAIDLLVKPVKLEIILEKVENEFEKISGKPF